MTKARLSIVLAAVACALAAAAPAHAVLEPLGDQLRLSRSGDEGTPALRAYAPAAAFDPASGRHLVVWWGDPKTDGDFEIYGRFTDADGTPVGAELQISSTWPGDPARNSHSPAVAYNSRDREFLVVWHGEVSGVDNDNEVWGQRISADGSHVGSVTRLSAMGVDNAQFNASDPRVAYNAARNEYLVVFWGQKDALGAGEGYEVWARRIGADLSAQGGGDFRVSAMGAAGQTHADGLLPAVVWNSVTDDYLVTWRGDNFGADNMNTGEVYIRLFEGDGTPIGAQSAVSKMGGGDPDSANIDRPNVAFNAVDNQYLLVWMGDDGPPGAEEQFEVYGQRLSAAGVEIGADDFRISQSGPDGQIKYRVAAPEVGVVHLSASNRYLVAWTGDTDRPPYVDEEFEVFGQELLNDGTESGGDFAISSAGPDSSTAFAAYLGRAMSYDPARDQVLVPWDGDDDLGGSRDGDFDVFLRRVGSPPAAAPPPPPAPAAPAAPAARIVPAFRVGTLVLRGRRRVLSMKVLGLRRGARVTLICNRGCGRRNRTVRRNVRARRSSVRLVVPRRSGMRIGARIEVRVSLRGHLSRYATYRLTTSSGPKRTGEGCLNARRLRIACPG